MIRCVRIWTGSDRQSHFEEGAIHLTDGARGDLLSGKIGSTSVSFQETRPGGTFACAGSSSQNQSRSRTQCWHTVHTCSSA